MSKHSKTEYKNKENDSRYGKVKYQERVIDEQIAEKEISDFVKETNTLDYEDNFDDIRNKLL